MNLVLDLCGLRLTIAITYQKKKVQPYKPKAGSK